MKTKIILTLAALLAAFSLSAQENESIERFPSKGNWFIQIGGGMNTMFNNGKFGSFGAAIELSAGKWLSPDAAVRFGLHGISNSTFTGDKQWFGGEGNFYQLMGTADLMWDVITTFGGKKPTRIYSIMPYARVAALSLSTNNKSRGWNSELGLGAGLHNSFRMSERTSFYFELSAVASKEQAFRNEGRFILFPTATAGVTINLGKQGFRQQKVREIVKEVTVPCEHPNEINALKAEIQRLKDRPKEEKVVEKPAQVVREEVRSMTVFFDLGKVDINGVEKDHLISFFDGPTADGEISIIGLADSTTGNSEVNKRLSEQRAQAVKDFIVGKAGVKTKNIVRTSGLGETDAYGSRPESNRCVVVNVTLKK